ncbi:MAG: helix-turn-helix transcriptional regulator [Alphaproteobacteria bacterium]|nr:helix-turn-helix transcriptional regulator [Alphaproteobacteria bacterium]
MYKYILPTPEDIVGARSYLRLSQGEFAKKAGIAKKTLFNIENRKYEPSREMLEKVQKTFLSEGIVFLHEGGFKANQSLFRVLEGESGVEEFFDDLVATAHKDDCHEIISCGVDEDEFESKLDEMGILDKYVQGLRDANNFTMRTIISKDYIDQPFEEGYLKAKLIPPELFMTFPIYVYENKLAILMLHSDKVFIISDPVLADSYRKQFHRLWENPSLHNFNKLK